MIKYILIGWILLVFAMIFSAHAQDRSHLVKQEELSKNGYIVYKDTVTKQIYVEALMIPTNEGFIMPDGLATIICPKELSKEDHDFILAFINYKLAAKKAFQ